MMRAKLSMVMASEGPEWLLLHLLRVVGVGHAEVIETQEGTEDENKDSQEGEEENYQG